ncbi:MAG: hypothetical protein KatS3mg029_0983 [Saprospiraceae bacterium]|nr:MAG: hypothetical protein KatS3mg029_0983 [Saprospiraceae bacterium]
MHRLSSNWTLFFKVFLPTFWLVFFGSFTIGVLMLRTPSFGSIPALTFKLGVSVFFVGGSALLYFTLMRLLRVDADGDHLYVSNYFKTYRYPFEDIETIREINLVLFHLVRIDLRGKGAFGRRISFLLDESMLEAFFEKYPEAAGRLPFEGHSPKA